MRSSSRVQTRAFTRAEFVVATVIVMVIGTLLTVGFNSLKRGHHISGDRNAMRYTHVAMILFAQNNNTYLPGLDQKGDVLPASAYVFSNASGNTLSGGSMAARYYILLNGSYLTGKELLISKEIKGQHWKSPDALPTPDQFSFAALRIAESPTSTDFGPHAGRAREWRDNTNAQAILLADRNTGTAASPDSVRSVWSRSFFNPAWQGNVVWGDNHADFLRTPNARLGALGLNTKYAGIINTDDFLFSTDAASGGAKSSTASAMFGYTSENF